MRGDNVFSLFLQSAHFSLPQDGVLIYEGFYHDFGPLNLSQLYRFCKLLQDKLAAPELKGKSIVYYSSKRSPEDSSNSAWLVGGTSTRPPPLPAHAATCLGILWNVCTLPRKE